MLRLLIKRIRKFFQHDLCIVVLWLAFWAGLVFFGVRYHQDAISRIAKPQTQATTITKKTQIDGPKIVARTPFHGRCNQPGMIFQFAGNGILTTYSDGKLANTGEVLEQQDVFTQYRYTPPDRIELDLKDWLAAGNPVGRFSVPAIGEYELEVEVDVTRVGDDGEV